MPADLSSIFEESKKMSKGVDDPTHRPATVSAVSDDEGNSSALRVHPVQVKNFGDDRETARCIQRRYLKKKVNNAKNEQNTRDKKRKGTARRNENCSKLSLPPVVELIFTRGDVWRARDHTSKLTQVPVYSDNSAKRHPGGERKTPHHHLDVRKSAQAKSNDTQPFAKHRKLGWLQRGKRQWLPSANCKWCLPTTVRSPFTTLSRVNTGKREQAFLEMKYSPLNVDVKLKGDNVANIQCLSHLYEKYFSTHQHVLTTPIFPVTCAGVAIKPQANSFPGDDSIRFAAVGTKEAITLTTNAADQYQFVALFEAMALESEVETLGIIWRTFDRKFT
ncbi:hypothetical protein OS493_010158 [Desmophyllum pertusum]|uniref:Uncharacterized protein n=1 Tax=Desmophyllum pertusum TaxID=174260 RepID=A0A9W9YEI9_9CNID|nr:hypothetical protein OS493_010158 [Desmophyllum pertusum]